MVQPAFEEYEIGQLYRSEGRTVTETHCVLFTGICGINLPIFIDAEYCKDHSRFGARIVPGPLILGIAAGLMDDILGKRTIALLELDRVQAHAPGFHGDTFRVTATIIEKRATSKPEQGLLGVEAFVSNQRNEKVMSWTSTLLMKTKAAE